MQLFYHIFLFYELKQAHSLLNSSQRFKSIDSHKTNISEFQSKGMWHQKAPIALGIYSPITYYLRFQTRTMRRLLWLMENASMLRWTSRAFALRVLMAKSTKLLFRASPLLLLRHVFKRQRQERDLSHDIDVRGSVRDMQRSLYKSLNASLYDSISIAIQKWF